LKISAIIDSNVVSGTILLDDLSPLTLTLIHRYIDSGVAKHLTINTVNCQPHKTVFDFAFLNPYYVENLFVDVNGTLQEVMQPGTDQLDDTPNPLNDQVYTENQIPVLAEVEILEVEPVMRDFNQEFEALSHSPAPNLINMEDYSANSHFIFDDKGIRFTANGLVTIASDVFELNHSSELTVAILGDAPNKARLVLINQSGQERIVLLESPYDLYDRKCFSTSVVSSTMEARIELDYETETDARNIRIKDIYVGKTAQYFESPDMDNRVVKEVDITTYTSTSFIFDFERLPPFGLRTLLDFIDPSGLKIQFSNSRVRVSKRVNGTVTQTIMSPIVDNTKQIGVVIDDFGLKIYSNNIVVKETQFEMPVEPGDYAASLGSTPSDPDYDSNTVLKLVVVNKNPFES